MHASGWIRTVEIHTWYKTFELAHLRAFFFSLLVETTNGHLSRPWRFCGPRTLRRCVTDCNLWHLTEFCTYLHTPPAYCYCALSTTGSIQQPSCPLHKLNNDQHTQTLDKQSSCNFVLEAFSYKDIQWVSFAFMITGINLVRLDCAYMKRKLHSGTRSSKVFSIPHKDSLPQRCHVANWLPYVWDPGPFLTVLGLSRLDSPF